MADIAEAAREWNARRAMEMQHAREYGERKPSMGPTSEGMSPFTKKKRRRGRRSKVTPLSEASKGRHQSFPHAPPQQSRAQHSHPHQAYSTATLHGPGLASDTHKQTLGEFYGFSEDPPLPSATSFEQPPLPIDTCPPPYPLRVFDSVTKGWVPNPVLEWQKRQLEMSQTPHAVRGQPSAQYGVQSSSLNPNVTPSSRERLPRGRNSHSTSPSSESLDPAKDRRGAVMTGSSGNFPDVSGSSNEDPFNDHDQTYDLSGYGQYAYPPGAFGYQSTPSSVPTSAYNSRTRMYNQLGQQQQQQVLASMEPYGAQSAYDARLTWNDRYPVGPQFGSNEPYTASPQYGYAQQSAYSTQNLNSPYAGSQMPQPAFRAISQIPQGSQYDSNRSRQAEHDAWTAHFARLGARDNKEALGIYMTMRPEDQTKLIDACRHRAITAIDSNRANQAALATPNIRDSAPYTGFNANSKQLDLSSTKYMLTRGLDEVVQESQTQGSNTRSVRTVAHDPLAQASANPASSVATSSTTRPHAFGSAPSIEPASPESQDEAEGQLSRKIGKPGPSFLANKKFANDLTDELVNEICADPSMSNYTDRSAMPPAARVLLTGDGPSKLHGFGRSRGVRRVPPTDPASMGAGNVALNNMMQKKKKTPEESLDEGVQSFRNDSYDLVKELYDRARQAGLTDETIRSCSYGQANLPGDGVVASATTPPNPIGHGRPGSVEASPSTSTPAEPATDAKSTTRPPWSEPTAEAMQHLLISAMANLATHKNPKPDDPFNRYSQPPAHAIDHSATGNDSFFDEEWAATNPPARVGRDPRYQSEDGRTTYFEESNRSGRGSGGAFGRR